MGTWEATWAFGKELEMHQIEVDVTNVLQGSLDVLEGPRVEGSSPAGSYQLPICYLCAGVRERSH